MNKRETLVHLVAGLGGLVSPDEQETVQGKVRHALMLLAEIEKACGEDESPKAQLRAIQYAREAERERCAQVAEGFGVLPSVAAAIRGGA